MADRDFDPTFVTAVDSNGTKRRVPRHYMDNPILSRGLTLAPTQRETDRVAAGPTDEWTIQQLGEYATEHGIDVTGARVKADYLDAITNHHETTGPTPGPDETPVAGD